MEGDLLLVAWRFNGEKGGQLEKERVGPERGNVEAGSVAHTWRLRDKIAGLGSQNV